MICPYCGRLLADGEECGCRSASAPDSSAPDSSARESAGGSAPRTEVRITAAAPRPGAVRLFFRNIRQCFRSYFAGPGNAVGIAARIRDVRTGLFFAGLQAIFTGLFFPALLLGYSLLMTHRVTYGALTQSNAISAYALNILPSLMYSLLAQMHISPLFVFLLAFLLTAAVYFSICAAGWLFGAAAHHKTPYRSLLAAVGVASIPSLCLTVIGCVFALFWPGAGLFFFMAAVFTSLITSYAAIRATLDVDDNRLSMLYGLIWAVVLALVLTIALHILPYLISIQQTLID